MKSSDKKKNKTGITQKIEKELQNEAKRYEEEAIELRSQINKDKELIIGTLRYILKQSTNIVIKHTFFNNNLITLFLER